MVKRKFLEIAVPLFVTAVCISWVSTQVSATEPADTKPVVDVQATADAGIAETKKSPLQRRQEAKQRLADSIKNRDPKFTEAALNTGLLAQPQDAAIAESLSMAMAPAATALAATPLPNGINPAIDMSLPNWSYSPNLRKFVNSLPGLGYSNRNNLGQFIPVAVPDVNAYPGSDYYEIGLKDYNQQMHSDLPATGTRLRGYYQKNTTDPNVSAQHYLGPLIVAKRDRAVRIKFVNELGTGTAGELFLPVDTTLMGAGMGPLMVMPMGADRVGGAGATVELMAMQNHNLQVGSLVMLHGFTPAAYNGNFRVTAVPTMMSFQVTLKTDPGGPATVVGHVSEMFTENRADLHLHGGLTPWISDGTPHQWVTPVGETTNYKKGVGFQNVPDMVGQGKTIPNPVDGDAAGTYYYPNQQSSRLMFYHDHSWGITRLNVYAGEAAGYLVTDQVEDDLIDGNNVTGLFNTVPGGPRPVLPNLGGAYRYGIPLIIQDKSFVNDANTEPNASFFTNPSAIATPKTAAVDPLWYTHEPASKGGDLWFPHEYLPNENIFDPNGFWLYGRWDYGPWILPPMFPLNDVLPSPSAAPEAFMDTMTVNGTAFPYVEVPPTAVRFRILNACNDRMLNLQLYEADPCRPTELKMVNASIRSDFPTWPKDGRDGGVPDPCTAGPDMIQIGNECGFLAKVNIVPAQPVDFDYDRTSATFGNVSSTALWLAPAVRADVIVDFSKYKDGDILILYTDAPAPMSLYDGRYDLFTGQQDWRWKGGPPETPAGFGPNTRTIMQIRIKGTGTGQPFDVNSLTDALPKAFAVGQDPILVKESAFNAAYNTVYPDTFANIADESMNITGEPNGVARIMTEVPGFGYTTPPAVKIYAVGPGSGAQAVASLNGVTGAVLLTGGSGYTSAPLVTVTRALGDTPGLDATAQAIVSGGAVTTIVITSPGSNYLLVPTITMSGGGATVQATAQATLALGSVGAITVVQSGSGYTRPPLVYLTGGGGTGAIAGALLTGAMPFHGKIMVEGMDMEFGRMNAILGSIPNPLNPAAGAGPIVGGNFYIDPPTEIYNDGELALWRLTHLGVDSHSMHFHLVNVQVINRVDWTNTKKAPFGEEIGWKETIRTAPFEDIILAFKPVKMKLPFGIPESNRLLDPSNPLGSTAMFQPVLPPIGVPAVAQLSNVMTNFGWEYVWHCHLLGHEENDMMRPFIMKVTSTAPAASVLSVASTTAFKINLSWTDATPANSPTTAGNSSNEIGFRIERATGTNGAFAPIGNAAANATSYSDDTGVQTTTYRYRVVAYNSAGSATSNVVAAARSNTPPAPAAPNNFTAALATGPQVNLAWRDNANNETGFVLERSENGGPFAQIAAPGISTGTGATLTFTDTAVMTGANYSYRVKAVYVVPEGTLSSAYATVSISVTTPIAPTNLSAAIASSSSINVSWRDNSNNESSFTVWVSVDSAAATQAGTVTVTAAQGIATGGTVTFAHTGLASGHTYAYYATATNVLGESGPSNTAAVTAPVAPTNVTATIASSTSIRVSWRDASNNETSFEIWSSVDGAAATLIATVNRTGTQITSTANLSFTNTGLTAGHTYAYYVIAVNLVGPSAASNTATVNFTVPTAPSNVAVIATTRNRNSDRITLTWTNTANNQASFTVQRATNSAFTGASTSTVTSTVAAGSTVTFTQNVSRNVNYYYRVRANNVVGPSAYVNATPFPIHTP